MEFCVTQFGNFRNFLGIKISFLGNKSSRNFLLWSNPWNKNIHFRKSSNRNFLLWINFLIFVGIKFLFRNQVIKTSFYGVLLNSILVIFLIFFPQNKNFRFREYCNWKFPFMESCVTQFCQFSKIFVWNKISFFGFV